MGIFIINIIIIIQKTAMLLNYFFLWKCFIICFIFQDSLMNKVQKNNLFETNLLKRLVHLYSNNFLHLNSSVCVYIKSILHVKPKQNQNLSKHQVVQVLQHLMSMGWHHFKIWSPNRKTQPHPMKLWPTFYSTSIADLCSNEYCTWRAKHAQLQR